MCALSGVSPWRFRLQTIHCLYIFNRRGACLYYREWHRPHSTLSDNPSEDRKLLFGLHFSLKKLVQKLSPLQYVTRTTSCVLRASLSTCCALERAFGT